MDGSLCRALDSVEYVRLPIQAIFFSAKVISLSYDAYNIPLARSHHHHHHHRQPQKISCRKLNPNLRSNVHIKIFNVVISYHSYRDATATSIIARSGKKESTKSIPMIPDMFPSSSRQTTTGYYKEALSHNQPSRCYCTYPSIHDI